MSTVNILGGNVRQFALLNVLTKNGSSQERPMARGLSPLASNIDYALGACFIAGSSAVPMYEIRIKNSSEEWITVNSYVTKFSTNRSVGDQFHSLKAGEAKLELFNESQGLGLTNLFGMWNPLDSSFQYYDLTQPFRALSIIATYSYQTYPIFFGATKDVNVDVGRDSRLTISAVDQLQNVFDNDIQRMTQIVQAQYRGQSFAQVASLQNYPVMSVFKAMMPTSYGYSTVGVSCDAGVGSFNLEMFDLGGYNDKHDALEDLVKFGGLAIYATTDGVVRVRDSIHKSTSFFPFSTFATIAGRGTAAYKMSINIDRFSMINRATVELKPVIPFSWASKAASAAATPGGQPIIFSVSSQVDWVLANSVYNLDLYMDVKGIPGAGQNGVAARGVFDIQYLQTSPAAIANSIYMDIYASRIRVYSNVTASPATIQSLSIYGNPYYIGADILVKIDNSLYQAKYDVHAEKFDCPLWTTYSMAYFRASQIASERAYPTIECQATFRNLFPQQLQIDLMDRLNFLQINPQSTNGAPGCVRVYSVKHEVQLAKGTIHSTTYKTEVDTFYDVV